MYFYFCLLLSFPNLFRAGMILSLPLWRRPNGGIVSISGRTIFRIFRIPGPCPVNATSALPTHHSDKQNTLPHIP